MWRVYLNPYLIGDQDKNTIINTNLKRRDSSSVSTSSLVRILKGGQLLDDQLTLDDAGGQPTAKAVPVVTVPGMPGPGPDQQTFPHGRKIQNRERRSHCSDGAETVEELGEEEDEEEDKEEKEQPVPDCERVVPDGKGPVLWVPGAGGDVKQYSDGDSSASPVGESGEESCEDPSTDELEHVAGHLQGQVEAANLLYSMVAERVREKSEVLDSLDLDSMFPRPLVRPASSFVVVSLLMFLVVTLFQNLFLIKMQTM